MRLTHARCRYQTGCYVGLRVPRVSNLHSAEQTCTHDTGVHVPPDGATEHESALERDFVALAAPSVRQWRRLTVHRHSVAPDARASSS